MQKTSRPSTSTRMSTKSDDGADNSMNQLQQLNDIRLWVKTEAEFYGRTDEEFLLKFLHVCKFDIEKVKNKITTYYENRRNFPQWWYCSELNINKILSTAECMTTTASIDSDSNQPTVIITQLSRGTPGYTGFDDYVKIHSIIIETLSKRKSCQLNGVHWIVDCHNYSMRVIPGLMSPLFLRDLINYFMSVTVLRIRSINFVNTPTLATTAWKTTRLFIRSKLRDRFNFYQSDWSELFQHVSKNVIPEEYGGTAGPIKHHHASLLKEMKSQTDYILEDNQYGFHA